MTTITIDDAKNWAEQRIAKTTANQKTLSMYERTAKRNVVAGIEADQSNNARTRNVYKAAFRYTAAKIILKKIETGANDVALSIYEEVKRIEAKANANAIKYSKRQSFDNVQVRNSKAKALKFLPEDWKEKLLESAKGSKYEEELKVLAAIGCRPCELEQGVTVTKDAAGNTTFKILGAKNKTVIKGSKNLSSGQVWREVTLPAAHKLAASIKAGDYQANARNLEEAAKHWAEKTFRTPTNKPSKAAKEFSSYCFRHQFSSDMKANKMNPRDIAKALGHQSTASQQSYGNARSKSGGLSPTKVTAATAVRDNARMESKHRTTAEIKNITRQVAQAQQTNHMSMSR